MLSLEFPLAQKIALVTGAAGGIGRATARALAQAGAQVVVSDIEKDGGLETVDVISDEGGDAIFIEADVTNGADVAGLIQAIVDRFGCLDCAVNNAGIEGTIARTADISEAEFDQLMAVNIKGIWLCMKHEIPQMLRQGQGAIVNMASVAGLIGAHSMGAYAATKHAVVGLTRTAAVEYAGKGLRINAVCPAIIQTAMYERAIAALPKLAEGAIRNNPSHRLGQPEEVAQAVLWLCSDAASFTTGAALTVDGGLAAQ
jgi:NAD(P)-dependent dehydrogenase (short-subunit alcohol dehydrogenase family)